MEGHSYACDIHEDRSLMQSHKAPGIQESRALPQTWTPLSSRLLVLWQKITPYLIQMQFWQIGSKKIKETRSLGLGDVCHTYVRGKKGRSPRLMGDSLRQRLWETTRRYSRGLWGSGSKVYEIANETNPYPRDQGRGGALTKKCNGSQSGHFDTWARSLCS